jgi:hypothetical protein
MEGSSYASLKLFLGINIYIRYHLTTPQSILHARSHSETSPTKSKIYSFLLTLVTQHKIFISILMNASQKHIFKEN